MARPRSAKESTEALPPRRARRAPEAPGGTGTIVTRAASLLAHQAEAHDMKVHIITPDEEEKVLAIVRETHLFGWYAAIFLIETGAHVEEVFAMPVRRTRVPDPPRIRWSHVDFDSRVVRFKSDRGDRGRSVAMTTRLRSLLTDLRARSVGRDTEFVFGRLRYTQVRRAWNKACLIAEIKPVRLGELYHTRAARWLQGGLTSEEVGYMLGRTARSRRLGAGELAVRRALGAEHYFREQWKTDSTIN